MGHTTSHIFSATVLSPPMSPLSDMLRAATLPDAVATLDTHGAVIMSLQPALPKTLLQNLKIQQMQFNSQTPGASRGEGRLQ
jgi:hypothetical protein